MSLRENASFEPLIVKIHPGGSSWACA